MFVSVLLLVRFFFVILASQPPRLNLLRSPAFFFTIFRANLFMRVFISSFFGCSSTFIYSLTFFLYFVGCWEQLGGKAGYTIMRICV